jgi:hypothetical protein
MRTPDLSRESGNDLPQQNKNQIEKPPHMKKWYKVTVKATITKTQDIHATSQEEAEQEAMELFNPHSGEAEENYTQEVTSTEEVSEDPETKSILLEASWFAFRHHYEELAEHLDLSDDVLQPIKAQLDKKLGE